MCNNESKISIRDISLAILLFLTSVIITTSILFILGIPISIFNFYLSIAITAFTVYCLKGKSIRSTISVICVSGIVVLLCTLILTNVYDNTWDGAAYHKQAVGLLKEGWNPLFLSAGQFEAISKTVPYEAANPLKWAEVYPKATWYFAAVMYKLTGNIESGKAYTLLMMIVTFGIFYDYLKSKNFKRWQNTIISVLAAANPIAIAQIHSYYLDGIAACVMILVMLLFGAHFDKDYNQNHSNDLVTIFCLICIGCNLKFSILLFTAIYCIAYFIYNMYMNYKDKNNHDTLKKFIFFIVSSFISIVIVGASPYLTNLLRYKNVFFGLIGESGVADSLSNGAGIAGKSNVELFLASLFGKMSHGTYHSVREVVKFPFTVTSEELFFYSYVDTRMSGLGVLFSGVFVLSVLTVIYLIIVQKKHKAVNIWNLMEIILMIITMVVVPLLPGSFQQRYIGHIYIIPIYSILKSFSLAQDTKLLRRRIFYTIVSLCICTSIIANAVPWANCMYRRVQQSNNTTSTLKWLSSLDDRKNTIYVSLFTEDFVGIYYNLKDFNIEFKYVPLDEIVTYENYKLTYSNWLYYKVENLSD